MLGLIALALVIWYDFRMAECTMSNVKVRTIHSKQGTLQPTIVGTDQIVIAQADASSASGYRTVNITADQSYGVIKELLKTTPNLVAIGDGLLGTGVPSDPIRVDETFLNNHWVNKRFMNFAQVGARPGALLGSRSGYNFTWPGHPCFLAGISMVIPAQTINLYTVLSNPSGKTVYMYLIASNGTLKFEYSFEPRADRYDSAYLARFTFGTGSQASTIVDSDGLQFIRFGNYRLAEEAITATKIRGGSYPVSAGVVYEVGYTITGAIAGDSFRMNGTQLGPQQQTQDLWPGKTTDRIILMGSEVIASHAYSGIAMTEDGRIIKPILVFKGDSGVNLPTYLNMTAKGDSIVGGTFRMVKLRTSGTETTYTGYEPADDVKLNECIKRGGVSDDLVIQVRGSNTI